jgi:hypothetical protein
MVVVTAAMSCPVGSWWWDINAEVERRRRAGKSCLISVLQTTTAELTPHLYATSHGQSKGFNS